MTREYRRPTPAQVAAMNRNWRIFRLRGLYEQVRLLTGWRLKVARWVIERELVAMGATVKPKRPYAWRGQFNPHPKADPTYVEPEFEELPF